MAEAALASMFDLPSPPRAPAARRARSRSASITPEPQRGGRGESSVPARQAVSRSNHQGTSYRDHAPAAVSANKSRQAALALLDDWAATGDSADAGTTATGSKRALDDPMDFSADPDAKKRRAIPKIDSARLLSDEGLPALLHKARVFHVRGKGHEAKDLDNLLSMYQIWAHGMFPKATFKDTVTRIEKVCHQRDLKSRLMQWKQEEQDRRARLLRGSPSASPAPVSEHDEADAPADGAGGGADPSGVGEEPPQRAAGDAGADVDDDEMDEDALIAAAEADLALLLGDEEITSAHRPASALASASANGSARQRQPLFAGPNDDDDDFAALEAMAEMEEMEGM